MTIKENIALGLDDSHIDDARIAEVISISQLSEFIDSLPDGLDTIVGENGVKVSGGQLQRVGIARALYFDPEIIILDEATSSLDNRTELKFMESIQALKGKKTFIISAHRLSTIENCDEIHLLRNGKIESSGNYNDLITNSKHFREIVRTF